MPVFNAAFAPAPAEQHQLALDAAREIQMWRMSVQSTQDTHHLTRPGWVTLKVHFEDESQAAFVVLGFGAQAELLAPEGFRDRIRHELLATLRLYENTRGTSS